FYPDSIRVPHDPKTLANFKAGLRGSGFAAETYDLAEAGKIPEDWWPMAIAGRYPVDGFHRVGWPTEKPWPLLERIVRSATPLNGYVWLHGIKRGRMVHVGSVDAPITPSDMAQIAAEFRRVSGTGPDAPSSNGIDVLGWDFAFELNEVARQQAALAKLDVH